MYRIIAKIDNNEEEKEKKEEGWRWKTTERRRARNGVKLAGEHAMNVGGLGSIPGTLWTRKHLEHVLEQYWFDPKQNKIVS